MRAKCHDCGKMFDVPKDEAFFFDTQHWKPLYCRECREKPLLLRTKCDVCGGTAYVKFIPLTDSPILCSDCFVNRKRHIKMP